MRGYLACGTAAAMLSVAATPAVAAIAIDHSAVGCIVAAQYPRFEARFNPAAELSRARLHFRPAGSPHWYSVSMKPEGGVFAGVLPKPKTSLRQIEYYIEATDTSFGTSRTSEYKPDVASGPAACKDKLMAGALPSATVLIEAPAGAPLVPVGFDPAGVVSATPAPGSGSAPGAGSTGTPGTTGTGAAGAGPNAAPGVTGGAGGGGGIGTTGLVIGGVVAAGAGIGIAVAGGGSDSDGGSSGTGSGGGGTSGGGTTPPPCTPGPVTASLTNIVPATRCGQRFSNGVTVTNGSCAAITIQSVQVTQNAAPGPFCSANVSQSSFVPPVTSVAAGQTATVINFQSGVFCCAAGTCPGTTTCGYDETFVVQTNAGALPAGTIPLQVSFDATCAPCP